MSFASPLLLLGVGAAAVPLVIHLIGRRRAPRRRFAAIDFLLRSNRRVARRLRVRQLLLLATRMALAAGIAVMMAKPFSETESDLPALGNRPQSAVLVVDDTLSMQRELEGERLIARARAKARQLVALMGGQADVAVLTVSEPSGPLPAPTRQTRKVLAAIAGIKGRLVHRQALEALEWAGRVLAESSLPERHVFLISDLAAHGLRGVDRLRLPPGVQLHTIDVAPGEDRTNLAVVSVRAAASSAPGQRSTRIEARICNHGPTATSRRVTLEIDDKQVARGWIKLGARGCGTKAFSHTFIRGGMHNAAVSLAPDELAVDDRRHLRLEVESAIRVLLVNGAPSPIRHRDELFYLETALQEVGPGGQVILAKTINDGELGQQRLKSLDVVALCNVRQIPAQSARELEVFVERGGGLLVTVGSNVEAESYNRNLAGLLPVGLRGPLLAAPPGTGAPALRIGRVDSAHPAIAPIWSERRGGGLRRARFQRVFRLRPMTRADRRVIFWYDDGSPALVEGRRGEGRVLLFTSTVDRDWNDLSIRPGYLPLMQQMVLYLSRVGLHAPHREVAVGDVERYRPARTTRQVHLVDPTGAETSWAVREADERRTLEIRVEHPGLYQLSAAGVDGVLHVLERDSFMANVDPRESDLRRSTAGIGPGQRPAASAAKATRRVELWHLLGALLLALLVLESFLIRRG